MKHAACALLFVAATGLSLAAAESDEPLAGVKQELKDLQSESTAQKKGEGDSKLKPGMPALIIPSNGPSPAESPSARRKLEQERKKQKQAQQEKDWLLREYDKLEREADAKRDDKLSDETKAPEPQKISDQHDESIAPTLIAHDRDQKTAEKGSDSYRSQLSTVRAPDPMAPFMREWLATSPVRGPMFDSLVNQGANGQGVLPPPGAESGPVSGPGVTMAPIGLSDSSRTKRAEATPAVNPFLSGLDLPLQGSNSGVQPLSSPVAETLAPAAGPSRSDSLLSPPESIVPEKRNSGTPPPSKLADDKKYFPQQKRF